MKVNFRLQPVETTPLRLAETRDAEAIVSIYNQEVMHSFATYDLVPRELESQREWLEQRSGALAVVVADLPEIGVVGFAAISTYRDRAGYRTTVEDSVYVHRSYQRRGLGRVLLSSLVDLARNSGFHTMIARIDSESESSLALHRALDFRLVGIEHQVARKFGRWRDSTILQKML